MPVGTHGAVRGLSMEEVRRTGAQIVLGNTYHLHLRPGEEVVRALGGLQRFTTWNGPMLTDSGGFQVFSLAEMRQITEEGVTFKSPIDGSTRMITPERAMEIQVALGADIAMAFDQVVPGQSDHAAALEGMERTLRWLERCRDHHASLLERSPSPGRERGSGGEVVAQTFWPIVQGGTHDDLRLRSLEGTLARGPWSGIAIGGLSVGEPKADMIRVLDHPAFRAGDVNTGFIDAHLEECPHCLLLVRADRDLGDIDVAVGLGDHREVLLGSGLARRCELG